MTKATLHLLIGLISLTTFAQIKYEKGYFIDNNDNKTNCLIKNLDWADNPKEFQYKLTENAKPASKKISAIKEFGVSDLQFIKTIVRIDRSREDAKNISLQRAPIFKQEELLLKTLIDGPISLYQYRVGSLNRFFIKNESKVEQLVFKSYLVDHKNIKKNNRYKQQLWELLKCDQMTEKDFKHLRYHKKELTVLFKKYYQCQNIETTNYETKKEKKDLFNLTLRPGINFSSLSITNDVIQNIITNPNNDVEIIRRLNQTNFETKLNFRFGIELELIANFNKNKWGLIVEPTYRRYKDNGDTQSLGRVEVDYKSLEIPIGIRHYMFLNDNSKLFLNASWIFDIPLNSKITFENGDNLSIHKNSNLSIGMGYKIKNKYSIEANFQTNRDILSTKHLYWDGLYQNFAIIFGCTIF